MQATQPQHTVHQQQVGQGGQVLQTQGGQVLAPTQSGNTTITTMSPLQQGQPHPQQIGAADWGHGRAVSYFEFLKFPLLNFSLFLGASNTTTFTKPYLSSTVV